MPGRDAALVLVFERAEGSDAERGQGRVGREREEGRQRVRGRERGDVAVEGGVGGGGEEASERVGVGEVEGARAPEEVANVHEEAVESRDAGARGEGSGFERDFVARQDGAEPGEGGE